MAKIKKDIPFFLEFINLPIIEQTGEGLVGVGSALDGYRQRIRGIFKRRLKEGHLPQEHTFILKQAVRDVENCSIAYIGKITRIWFDIRFDINALITGPKPYKRLCFLDRNYEFNEDIKPILSAGDNDNFKIQLVAITPQNFLNAGDIVGFVYADFIQFMGNHYRKGIFGNCQLEDCDRIIITANNTKSCCRAHGQKASREKKKLDSDYAEYKMIRNRLYKRYKRHPSCQSWNFEDYLQKEWPAKKIDLYRRFAQALK